MTFFYKLVCTALYLYSMKPALYIVLGRQGSALYIVLGRQGMGEAVFYEKTTTERTFWPSKHEWFFKSTEWPWVRIIAVYLGHIWVKNKLTTMNKDYILCKNKAARGTTFTLELNLLQSRRFQYPKPESF